MLYKNILQAMKAKKKEITVITNFPAIKYLNLTFAFDKNAICWTITESPPNDISAVISGIAFFPAYDNIKQPLVHSKSPATIAAAFFSSFNKTVNSHIIGYVIFKSESISEKT